MNKCNDCKQTFQTPGVATVIHFEVTERDREYFAVCPHCGSSDWEAMRTCEICTRPVMPGEDYCQEHKDMVIDLMAELFDKVYKDSFADRKKIVGLVEWWLGEELG